MPDKFRRFAIVVAVGIMLCAVIGWWLNSPIRRHPMPIAPEPLASTLPGESAPSSNDPGLSLKRIAAQLADDSTRPVALGQLNNLPYQRIGALLALARDTADARVKSDLNRRAIDLQQQVAAAPPPISIHLKDAPLADFIAALNEEMATQIIPNPSHPITSSIFDVQQADKPFWQVILAAAEQHPISFNSFPGHLFLAEDPRGMAFHCVDGPFCLYAWVRDNQPLPDARVASPVVARPLKWIFRYTLGIDPRLRALSASLHVTMTPDDAGNVLLKPNEPFAPHPDDLLGNACYAEADLLVPVHPGRTIPSLKVTGKILLVTSELETVLNFTEPVDQHVQLGSTVIDVKFLTRTALNRTDVTLSAHDPDGHPVEAVFTVIDGLDTRVGRRPDVTSGFNYRSIPPPPFQLDIKTPRTTEERPVSFEIDNLPLPILSQ